MKRKLIAIALAGAVAPFSMNAAADSTGCGLGSMLWDGQQGIFPQVLAVTTNGTSGNQTFGITSGTLGCEQDGVIRSSAALGMYTGSNIDMIARDMSIGSGESLDVLADLMGIEADDREHFFTALQSNYGNIFPSADVTAEDVISAIDETLRRDERLVRYSA
ncbi:hypothetical protein J2T57_003195 [Natronocella acetinitrilica]|uniref:DUF3015 domain-containing protein n=1 Tax=Natronocella acetinitrilica TaxID=414046 RepID=A0AAE3G554_9GAMM|nr:DUF3015 domain-containing protein [Natronocella acetinitrilica]MCP1676036.1 hypothetical protein [Natronocella acetinitrilica]